MRSHVALFMIFQLSYGQFLDPDDPIHTSYQYNRPNPRFGNQKNYPRTRQTRQYFPWGGQIPPFGGGKSDFENTRQQKQYTPWGKIPPFGQTKSFLKDENTRQQKQYTPWGKIPPFGHTKSFLEDEMSDSIVFDNTKKADMTRETKIANCPFCKCGQSKDLDRIVGGKEAEPHSFPWSVSLRVSWGTYFCGGAIIDEKFILTAAHCVAWGREILNAVVVVGAHHLDEISNSDKVTEHTIKKVKYHIKYNKETTDSDVALIELNEPIEFRENARPVCLPAETDSFIGHNATVVGWGKVREYGPSSRFLRRVDVEIIKTDDCKKAYKPINVTNNMICAWHPKGGKDACQGDSGGPLMVKENDQWTQVGIVSWGRGCGLPQYPGVYTRVTAFRDWIHRHGDGI